MSVRSNDTLRSACRKLKNAGRTLYCLPHVSPSSPQKCSFLRVRVVFEKTKPLKRYNTTPHIFDAYRHEKYVWTLKKRKTTIKMRRNRQCGEERMGHWRAEFSEGAPSSNPRGQCFYTFLKVFILRSVSCRLLFGARSSSLFYFCPAISSPVIDVPKRAKPADAM